MPGRLDRLIYVGLPDERARQQILGLHTSRMPLSVHFSLSELASATDGYSGAELSALCREAAQMALHERLQGLELTGRNFQQCPELTGRHFQDALAIVQPRTSSSSLKSLEMYTTEQVLPDFSV